jgi:hypothetical protein
MLDRRGFLLCSLGAALPFTLYSWSRAKAAEFPPQLLERPAPP